jgi:hypothetical protein
MCLEQNAFSRAVAARQPGRDDVGAVPPCEHHQTSAHRRDALPRLVLHRERPGLLLCGAFVSKHEHTYTYICVCVYIWIKKYSVVTFLPLDVFKFAERQGVGHGARTQRSPSPPRTTGGRRSGPRRSARCTG